MKRINTIKWIGAVIVVVISILGCTTPALKYPKTFIQGLVSNGISIDIPENIQADTVWQNTVTALSQKYQLATVSKEAGNIVTDWIYSAVGKDKTINDYRTRAILSFASDWKTVNLSTEANYLKNNEWISGYDTALLDDLKTEILKILGIAPK